MKSEHRQPVIYLSELMSMVQVGNIRTLSLDVLTIYPGAERTLISHPDMDEIFLIEHGSLRVFLGDEVFDARPGDCFEVPAGVEHGSMNLSGSPVRMIVCNTPSFDPAKVDEG